MFIAFFKVMKEVLPWDCKSFKTANASQFSYCHTTIC